LFYVENNYAGFDMQIYYLLINYIARKRIFITNIEMNKKQNMGNNIRILEEELYG